MMGYANREHGSLPSRRTRTAHAVSYQPKRDCSFLAWRRLEFVGIAGVTMHVEGVHLREVAVGVETRSCFTRVLR
jgi:hypothetical protein